MANGIPREFEVQVRDDGTLPPLGTQTPDGLSFEESRGLRLQEIIRLIDDSSATNLEDINRLIAKEMAYTLADPQTAWATRSADSKIKALRELSKTLQEGDALSRRDFLNFDGPKFRYVLREIIHLFQLAQKRSGVDQGLSNSVMRVFKDLFVAREPELRRETERLDGMDWDIPEIPAPPPQTQTATAEERHD